MFCPNCGSEISENDAFCGKCGTYFYADQGPGGQVLPSKQLEKLTLGEIFYIVIMVGGMIYQYITLDDQVVYAGFAPLLLGFLKDPQFPNFRTFSKQFKKLIILVLLAFSYVFYHVAISGTDDLGSIIFIILFPILVLMINLAIFLVSLITYTIGFLFFKLIRT